MKTEWVHKKLGDCCERICNGLTYDVEETQGYFVTRIETISDGYIDYNKIGHIPDKPNQDYLMVNGDILFSHINSVKHIGKVAYYDDSTELYHGMNLLLLRANNNIDKLFLFYLLSSDKYRRKIRTLAKSAVNQASISTTDLGKFEISYPADLSAQRRIAAILTSADKMIAATQKTIAKYKQIKQGMMEDLLKPKEGWKMVKLGEVGDFKNGINKDKSQFGFGTMYVSISDAYLEDINYKILNRLNATDKEIEEYALTTGDIVFVRSSVKPTGVGYTTLFKNFDTEPVLFSGFMIRYRLNDKVHYCPNFMNYLFRNERFRLQVISRATVSANTNINQESLKELSCAIPNITEQKRIAAILSGIDAKIAAEEKVLEKYEKVKKGLMEKLLEEKH